MATKRRNQPEKQAAREQALGRSRHTAAGRMLQSRVTSRWQTTLPSGVRKALGLDAGAEILYEVRGDYAVIRRAQPEEEDPVVTSFLDFLEGDMLAHPAGLTPVTESLVARLKGITDGVEVGPDEPIEGPVAL